ncbi:MAG: hypothetical protein OD815_000894 [Candidatus Alkanophagales archaeon MCA70_species_2]|nr:hypothetical protein [Candidatus Alkanophaga liquidiphilum]
MILLFAEMSKWTPAGYPPLEVEISFPATTFQQDPSDIEMPENTLPHTTHRHVVVATVHHDRNGGAVPHLVSYYLSHDEL